MQCIIIIIFLFFYFFTVNLYIDWVEFEFIHASKFLNISVVEAAIQATVPRARELLTS